MPKINVNNIDLYYEVTGHGRPLILVHGNREDHTIFDKTIEVLKSDFTCYAIDSRGHGQSTPIATTPETPNEPSPTSATTFTEFHYRDMAADIQAFMEALDLRDVVFVGFSDGGIIGLLAASQVSTTAQVSPAAQADATTQPGNATAHPSRITALVPCGANVKPNGVKLWFTIFAKAVYAIKEEPLFKLMLTEPDITDQELLSIKAETLVLAGEKDLITRKETDHIAAMIPRAEERILPREDHGSYIVHSEKLGQIIKEWITK